MEDKFMTDAELEYQHLKNQVKEDEAIAEQQAQEAAQAEKQVEELKVLKEKEALDKQQPLNDKKPEDELQQPLGPFEGAQYEQIDGESVKTEEYRRYEHEKRMREIEDRGLPVLKQMGRGVGDFMADAVETGGKALDAMNPMAQMTGGIGGEGKVIQHVTQPLADFWNNNTPKPKTMADKVVRDASAIIIPNIIGTGWGLQGAKALTTAGTKGRVAANLAAVFGPDLAVTGVTRQSTTEHNFSKALNDWLGAGIPWATTGEDSPDTIWWKHVADSVMMSGFGELLGLAFSKVGKQVQYLPESDSAKKAMRDPVLQETDEILKNDFVSPRIKQDAAARRTARLEDLADTAGSVEIDRLAREASMTDEGMRRLRADPLNNNGPDPYINKLSPEEAPIQNATGNPIKAKTDLFRIQNNIGTYDGMMSSPTTEYWLKEYMEQSEPAARSAYLKRLFADLAEPVSAIMKKGGNLVPLPADAINDSMKKLVSATTFEGGSFKEYAEGLALLKEGVGVEMAEGALKASFDEVFSTDNLQASAMLAQQFADNVHTASEAMEIVGRAYDTRQHQQLVFRKLQALSQEVEAAKYAQGKATEALQAAQMGDMANVAEQILGAKAGFRQGLKSAKSVGDEFISEMNAIAQHNPEWAKPMISVYNATGGDVDTLHKLKIWTEQNLGLFKKSVYDWNDPTVPSQLVEQLWGVKYNSVLSGKSSLRALTGNGLMMAAKPISAFAGSALRGDMKDFARSTYIYGGIAENFQRGWKEMVSKWKHAVDDPMASAKASRQDISGLQSSIEKQESLSHVREGLRADWKAGSTGAMGQLGYLNITEALRAFNNHPIPRFGVNALTAVDGLARSVMQSGVKRALAYDMLLKETPGGVVDPKAFDALQKKLYNDAFGPDGMIVDSHAKWATNELALNLPNEMAVRFEGFMKQVPAARALFMFSRTGLNAVDLTMTFTPGATLIPGLTRANRAFRAVTDAEIIDSLVRHGYDEKLLKDTDIYTLHDSIKSEYIGRQVMGAGVVIAGGIYALNGNLTGAGPSDYAELQKMRRTGWEPHSIRNPLTGEWHSYLGFEPYDKILGLTATIMNQATRVEQTTAEQWMLQLGWAMTSNIGSNTFMAGIQPLAAMYSGDLASWKRFVAMQADQIIPGSGARTVLNNGISPGLEDVEKTVQGYLANKWKFLPHIAGALEDELDFYTGEQIRVNDNPINAAVNALLPMFKSNGKIEPWRQWLLKTEWRGLSEIRQNRVTMQAATPAERQFISKYVGTTPIDWGDHRPPSLLRDEIKRMSQQTEYMDEFLRQAAADRGQNLTGKDQSIFKTPVHEELTRLHNIAIDQAWAQWQSQNVDMGVQTLRQAQERFAAQGNAEAAAGVSREAKQILEVLKFR